MILKSYLDLQLAEIEVNLYDMIVYLPKEQHEKYERLLRLLSLSIDGLRLGWEELDWRQAEKEGLLCKRDYKRYNLSDLLNECVVPNPTKEIITDRVGKELI